MSVVYNGVDLDQFHPSADLGEAERRALGIDGTVLLYVGRVCRQKGSDTLLEAYRKLRRDTTTLRLVVCGPIGQFGRETDPRRLAGSDPRGRRPLPRAGRRGAAGGHLQPRRHLS